MIKTFTQNLIAIFTVLTILSPHTSFSQDWADDPGGIFNIPAEEYNPTYHGYGSYDNVIYNKIDLQNGKSMNILNSDSNEGSVPLYDYLGNQVALAYNSPIGRNHEGADERDGGIIASALADIKVGNTTYKMTYAWSVNIEAGGRRSGWIKLSDLDPSSTIEDILEDTKAGRMAILNAAGINSASYDEYEVISAVLPAYAEEYYVVPGRDEELNGGKAKYYFTRDDYISGIKNIPETGQQRYGVAHNNIPLGAKFYRDMSQDIVSLNIYAPSSSTAISTKLKFVWGYTVTSANEKIYSFVNEDTLEPTGITVGDDTDSSDGEFIPDPNKLYYIDNPNWNLRLASTGESEDAYTTSTSTTGNDVLWKFVAKGNGYWHIQRAAGGSKPRLRTDNSTNADMQETSSSGIYTYYDFPTSTTSGTYYATLPDGPSNFDRLQVDNNGDVKMVPSSYQGTWVSFKFTEASESTTGDNDDGNNIAPLGTASQSSTSYNGSASRAIDRNTNGVYRSGSVTHTSPNTSNPYWQVKWNDNYLIEEIIIYNRTDCCTSRLSNFRVLIYDDSGDIVFNKTYTSEPSPSLTINTGGVTGKHVRVQLFTSTNALSLAEVEVYGEISNSPSSSCDTYSTENFNSGYGIWNDGGGDAYRGDFSDLTPFSNDCIRIRDDESGSNITTDVLNLSDYDEANINFQFYPISMESDEDFFLEVSTNGGSSYTTVQEWNSGVEFENDKLYSESVSIPSNKLATSTVFRFRCDASVNGDQVYLDNIVIETCEQNSVISSELNTRERVVISEEKSKLRLYPNPAQDVLNVHLEGNSTISELEVISAFGRPLSIHKNIDDASYKLDLTQLESNQAYLAKITTSTGEVIVNKFLKL